MEDEVLGNKDRASLYAGRKTSAGAEGLRTRQPTPGPFSTLQGTGNRPPRLPSLGSGACAAQAAALRSLLWRHKLIVLPGGRLSVGQLASLLASLLAGLLLVTSTQHVQRRIVWVAVGGDLLGSCGHMGRASGQSCVDSAQGPHSTNHGQHRKRAAAQQRTRAAAHRIGHPTGLPHWITPERRR